MKAGLSLLIGLCVLAGPGAAVRARAQPAAGGKAYLGVGLAELSALDRRQPGLKRYRGYGVMIQNVLPGTPAAKAGFQAGDAIMRIKGKWVSTPEQVIRLIGSSAVGTRVVIEILRQGKWLQAKVLLTPRPSRVPLAPGVPGVTPPQGPGAPEPGPGVGPGPGTSADRAVLARLKSLESEVRRLRKTIEELKTICRQR